MKNTAAIFIVIIIVLTACEKVIQVKTNSSQPQLVIEGDVTNAAGPYIVRLSMSVNYNQSNTFPAVSNAQVVIADNAGNTDTLKEATPGMYQTSRLKGLPGRQYTLMVTSDGKQYRSVSTMPALIDIQRLELIKARFSINKADSLDVNCVFNDPAGVPNYYRIVQIYNQKTIDRFEVFNDKYYDGNTVKYTVSRNEDDRLKKGDSLKVELRSIDQPAYEYYFTLSSITEQNGPPSASPANPTTNITGGALGYFSAYSVSAKVVAVQ